MQRIILLGVVASVLFCARGIAQADEAEPAVLGLKLGMRIAEAQSVLDRMKSEFPIRENYTAPDPAGGPAYTAGIESRTNNGARRLYLQFSPPFDGQKLVAIERKVLYSVPGQSAPPEFEPAPKVKLTAQALLERYGADPLRLFPMGELFLWPLDNRVLTDDDILKRCVYANERVANNLINGTRGCGRTLQALIEPNFAHPTLVGAMRIDLVDQDRLLELQSAGQEVEIKQQEKQRAKQGSAGNRPNL